MPVDIIKHVILSLSQSAPYLVTLHLYLHRIGCKHIPSYFTFPIVKKTACVSQIGLMQYACYERFPGMHGVSYFWCFHLRLGAMVTVCKT